MHRKPCVSRVFDAIGNTFLALLDFDSITLGTLSLRNFHNGFRKFQLTAITGCLHFQDAGEINVAPCIGVENMSQLPVAETPYGIHRP